MKLIFNKAHARLRGLLSPPIPYEVRNPLGDWSPYFGNYVGQKYGQWDTQTCWSFAGAEICETQLEYLWKHNLFSDETKKWFRNNGYIDGDGDFYLSRRWVAILSGVRDNGNEQKEFWRLASVMGLIPFTMLPYSHEDAFDEFTRNDFNNEYFNPDVITSEMRALGKEFLKRVRIEFVEVGKRWNNKDPKLLLAELKQSPLQMGVTTKDTQWNQEKVKWNWLYSADHSVELYKYEENSDYPYYIYDSYEPHLKRLSADYYTPIVTKAVLTAIPQPISIPNEKKTIWVKVWEAVHAWFESLRIKSLAV